MHIRISTTRRNGTVYRYAQIVESFRRPDGMPAHRVIASLGQREEHELGNLRAALEASRRGQRVVPASAARALPTRVLDNLAYLDVAVALDAWRKWGLSELLAELLPRGNEEVSSTDVVAALTIHRCVDPGSKLSAMRWFPRTALPELIGIPPAQFNNTRLHRVLSAIERCGDSLQQRLATRYAAREGAFAALFVDVTNAWFVGRGPVLAQKCKTKEGMVKRAIGIVLLCNEHGYPLRWQVVGGKESEARAMSGLLGSVAGLQWAQQVPVACDRAMGRTAYLRDLLATGLRFVTALTVAEFGAYTGDRISHASLAGIEAGAQASRQAAIAVAQAGMSRVNDSLYVLDAGVRERQATDDVKEKPSSTAGDGNPAQQALRLALAMGADVDTGGVSWPAAARERGLRVQRAYELRQMLKLAPALRDEILAGNSPLSLSALYRIARLSPQEQLEAHERQSPVSARSSTAARDKPANIRVRVVVAFNPDHFAEQRGYARQALAAVDSFVQDLNRRLAGRARRTREAIYAEVDRELRRRDLLDAFDVRVEEQDGRAAGVQVLLRHDAWQRRRRYDGFTVIVASPDCAQTAAQLATLYRAKDAVEKDFQTIKSIVELRPIWHRTDEKVRAHVTLCMLALLLERTIERTLAEKKARLTTASSLLEELAPVHLNRLCLAEGDDKVLYTVTEAKPDQRKLLGLLGLESLLDNLEVNGKITPRS